MASDYGRRQKWRQEAIQQIVESLAELGQEACRHAVAEREYNNRLYNLRDSIGSAVYVDGRIVLDSQRYAFSESSLGPYTEKDSEGNKRKITGREAIDRYWENNPTLPSGHNTIELVVVAATFYAGILEDRGIQVISAAADFLEDEMYEYKSYRPKLRVRSGDISIL